MSKQSLPAEILWDPSPDGSRHASDLALAALADGETSLVPSAVQAHVDGCVECTHRFGEAALLSVATSRAVCELGPLMRITPVPVSAPASAKKTLPVPMLAAACVLAAIGALPTLAGLPTHLAELSVTILRALPTLSRSGAHLAQNGAQNGMGVAWLVTIVCCALVFMASVAVTRLMPKPSAQ
jgi:hypothetical protein